MTAMFDAIPTPELLAQLAELKKREVDDRKAMLDAWLGLGGRFDELRERHLRGMLGKSSWSAWLKRHGFERKWVERWIDVARADDPATRLDEILLREEKLAGDRDGERKKHGPIIIKRPGVIFGYVTDLDDAGKREFFALCWRNYPRLLRAVGDDLGVDPDDDRPSLHA